MRRTQLTNKVRDFNQHLTDFFSVTYLHISVISLYNNKICFTQNMHEQQTEKESITYAEFSLNYDFFRFAVSILKFGHGTLDMSALSNARPYEIVVNSFWLTAEKVQEI